MSDSDDGQRIVQFENLNLLGKVVYVGGFLSRVATGVVGSAFKATSEIINETEKAFKDGMDPNIEEAKIIDETEDPPQK